MVKLDYTSKNFVLCLTLIMIVACGTKNPAKVLPVYITETEFITFASDTIYPNIKGQLWKGILYEDKYYCLYSYREGEGYKFPVKRDFIVFDKFGENICKYEIAKGLEKPTWWSSFKTQNDSLLFVPKIFNDTLYFNTDIGKWETVHDIMIPNYEDENYIVSSVDNGEFGGMVYFRNKETNALYGAIANSVVAVNKLEGDYYISNYLGHMMDRTTILKISEPEQMLQLSDFVSEQIMWNSGVYSTKGTTLIFEGEIELLTSFIHQGKFLHMYMDEGRVNIGSLENGELKKIHKFDDIKYAWLVQQRDSNYQLLQFEGDENISGFIETTPYFFSIHYIISNPKDFSEINNETVR